MGASQAREADARLSLAVPRHKLLFGRRRILDPDASRCAVCKAKFAPIIRRKHYCRRCGSIVCDNCTSLRLYGDHTPPPPEQLLLQQQKQQAAAAAANTSSSEEGAAHDESGAASSTTSSGAQQQAAASADQTLPPPTTTKFRVCTRCNLRRSAVVILPEACWELIFSFTGTVAHHHALQSCRRLQLIPNLPFPSGSGWDTFFGESTFLAKGANGAVYKSRLHAHIAAKLKLRGTPTVAVKVINKATVFSLRKWSHVLREVDALMTCRHQNILRLLGVFQVPDAVFMVLECAPGGDVFDWIVARRGCTETEARGIMRQLLVALQHMHDNCGAVHRDVKPENLLLLEKTGGAGRGGGLRGGAVPAVVLGDFGYARVFPDARNPRRPPTGAATALAIPAVQAAKREAADRAVTAAATPCGTLGFAPPEVLKAYADRKQQTTTNAPAAPVTPVEIMKKTDIFAAGVTLCLLLTSTEPFPCHSSSANVAAVHQGVNFDSRPWAHVSTAARSLVQQMLAPRAEDRPTAYDCLASSWFAGAGGVGQQLGLRPTTGTTPMVSAATPITSPPPAMSWHGGQEATSSSEKPDPELARSLRRNTGTYTTVVGKGVEGVMRVSRDVLDHDDDVDDRKHQRGGHVDPAAAPSSSHVNAGGQHRSNDSSFALSAVSDRGIMMSISPPGPTTGASPPPSPSAGKTRSARSPRHGHVGHELDHFE